MKALQRSATLAGGLLACALISACGGAIAGDPYGNVAPAQAPPAAIPEPSVKGNQSTAAATPALELVAAKNAALGWVVTDGKGWILYRFDKDRAKPTAKSLCTGACAQKWPPVVVHGTPVLKGVSSSIVGKVRREDGTWQLTLHGWPVYRFAGDAAPGQWKGQGVGGTWYTIKRTGARNTVLPAAPAPAASASASAGGDEISDPYGNSSDGY